MGNKKLLGEDILFDTTPSPGASICVAEGADNARTTVAFRPEKWQFDEEAFKRDFPMAA
jgi:malate dehydrogenase (quinone)